MQSSTSTGGEIGFLLFLVFLVLKLTRVINWSWWWITAPLWIPVAFLMAVALFSVLLAALFNRGAR